MEDPVLEVYHLLLNNWDVENTSMDEMPSIHTGWFDRESSEPQVTVSTPREFAQEGFNTPFTGWDPTGGGPVQTISGTLSVNCWSDRDRYQENPKKLTFEFSEEVKRIVKAHTLDPQDLTYIGYGGRSFRPDTDATPTLMRYSVRVEYSYREE